MELIDQIRELAEKVLKNKDYIKTEEATKSALVVPFIQILGYDTSNPREVIPEFITDYGAKNNEKIDYAILKNNQPVLVIECKHHLINLDKHYTQTHRYFHMTIARIGILTNGIQYNFYADLDAANKMDEKPFLSIDITSMNEQDIKELANFHKNVFDVDAILTTAKELKYFSAIKNLLISELSDPSIDFIRYFIDQVYIGRLGAKKVKELTEIFKKSFNRAFNDIIREKGVKSKIQSATNTGPDCQNETKIITTQEEIDGYNIVKAILWSKIDPSRIFSRDVKSYFSIILDDKNTKPLCHLWLNNPTRKYIGLFDKDKKETRYEIASLNDIYKYSENLIATLDFEYIKK